MKWQIVRSDRTTSIAALRMRSRLRPRAAMSASLRERGGRGARVPQAAVRAFAFRQRTLKALAVRRSGARGGRREPDVSSARGWRRSALQPPRSAREALASRRYAAHLRAPRARQLQTRPHVRQRAVTPPARPSVADARGWYRPAEAQRGGRGGIVARRRGAVSPRARGWHREAATETTHTLRPLARRGGVQLLNGFASVCNDTRATPRHPVCFASSSSRAACPPPRAKGYEQLAAAHCATRGRVFLMLRLMIADASLALAAAPPHASSCTPRLMNTSGRCNARELGSTDEARGTLSGSAESAQNLRVLSCLAHGFHARGVAAAAHRLASAIRCMMRCQAANAGYLLFPFCFRHAGGCQLGF